MRLARRSLKTVYLKRRIEVEDDEANVTHDWGPAISIQVNVQPAGGSVNAAIYGEELTYMKSIMYQGNEIQEGRDESAGLCLNVSADKEPDYKITAITTYSDHLIILAKKVNHE
ncbi:hypothetical protein [Levilactobacillus enshiensis]|uniref:hypothetical protein n=1 Tax=Levilactobacillus enshiensis TaxID=2590213 RepID=UPI001179DFD8|nr:hypothetical protein [Levilactobacillus enshiensis]